MSVSTAFAVSDDGDAVSEINDEITIEDSVLAVSDDAGALGDDDADVLGEVNDDELSEDQASNVVTKDSFFHYFDESGVLLDNVTTDELEFTGDFSGLDINYVMIDHSIKFTGKNVSFDNVTFVVAADDVTIDGFTLTQSKDMYLINIAECDNVVLSNNILSYEAMDGLDSFAVYASMVDNLKLINNTIIYVGNTDGTSINNAVRIEGYVEEDDDGFVEDVITSTNIFIENNIFDISMPSTTAGYDANWNSAYYSEGIVVISCENVSFKNNTVDLDYDGYSGMYDTINVLVFGSSNYAFDEDYETLYPYVCENVTVSDNIVNALGHNFIYGISMAASESSIEDNTLSIASDYHYADGIQICGPSSDIMVSGNTLILEAPDVAYGVYSYQYMGAIEDIIYYDNVITATAYAVCAMEIVEKNPVITENVILIEGNHTIGIAIDAKDYAVIALNNITVSGSNVGNASTGDAFIHMESTAISAKGDVTIRANNIYSTAIGINLLQAGDIAVEDNVITVEAEGNASNYAICADDIDSLNVTGNDIVFIGATDGVLISNGVLISGIDDVLINDNVFDLSLVSAYVPWIETPAGSKNWVAFPVSEGIVIEACDGAVFQNNFVEVSYNSVSGAYDTIYAVSVKDSDDVLISQNDIDAFGHTYIYGVQVSGEDFTVAENNITVESDIYYANGIDVEGPAIGVVADNGIEVTAPVSSYGIYSGMNGKNCSVVYEGNDIVGEAYTVFGMALGDVESEIVGNDIILNGNYTTGIAFAGSNLTVDNNMIFANGTNVGNESVWESFGVETVAIKAVSGNATIEDNNIFATAKGVSLSNDESVVIGNVISVESEGVTDNYAIYAEDIDSLTVTGNDIEFIGATDGVITSNAMFISGIDDLLINDNVFDLALVSAKVPWLEIPAGSGNWVEFPVSEGIVIESCDGAVFQNNTVEVIYNSVSGDYDTIYAVSVKDSDDVLISQNDINALGHTYIYGLQVSGFNFFISDNNITVESDNYYANGIDIEGPAFGLVDYNNVTVKAPVSVYGIYSGMNGQNTSVIYTNNVIFGESYNAFGMSLGDVESEIVNNAITLVGNYTTGIAYRGFNMTVADNFIGLISSEIGNESIWEGFGVETVGIKVIKGNASISDNLIMGNGKGVSLTGDADAVLDNNTIVVNASSDADAYAIYADGVPALAIVNNTVEYYGTTKGEGINNAVFIYNVTGALIAGNNFNLSLVSAYVPWIEIPAGSGVWTPFPVSEGIVIESSDVVIFADNVVNVTYNSVVGTYDTIYSVSFKDCDDIGVYRNEINALGHTYIYGIQISGDDFLIANNTINSESDNYYANGIDIEGPAFGVVFGNEINVVAPVSVYAIYSGMNGQDVYAMYVKNNITGEAYNVFGMSLGDAESSVVRNDMRLNGNYTTGIAFKGVNLTVEDNFILANGTNFGSESVWESFGVETVAVKVLNGTANIYDNTLLSTGKGIHISDADSVITDNLIVVEASGEIFSYGVYAVSVDDLKLINNNIIYIGNTDGTLVNNALRVESDGISPEPSSNIVVEGNEFDISMPATTAVYDENWNSIYYSEGIVFVNCENVSFVNNTVDMEYTDYYGEYDSLNVVVFGNGNFEFDENYTVHYPYVCKNVTVCDNVITAVGHNFIYGITMAANESVIENNLLMISSDYHYADAIQISGPSYLIFVEDNTIDLNAPDVVYGIYSYQYMGAIEDVIYSNNWIEGTAYAVCGMEIVEEDPVITENVILLNGNHTTGIAINAVDYAVIALNNITVLGSNIGNASTGDSFIHMESTGISAKGDVIIRANNISSTAIGINLLQAGDIVVEDNNITVEAEGNVNNYAICADDIDSLNVTGNDVVFIGDTDGSVISNGVYISGIDDVFVSDNEFELSLVSAKVPWLEIPAGSGNWVPFPVSEGIVIEACDGAVFEDNTVEVSYNSVSGDSDTIYAVSVKDSDDVIVTGNDIDAFGHKYIYGLQVSGENFTIAENDINVESDNYYANGIDIEGPATGFVVDNEIEVTAPVSVYGIYSGMNGQDCSVIYIGNDIVGEAYNAFGMSLGDVESEIVGNDIILEGNYTTGIAFAGSNLTVEKNMIFANGTNVGNESVWEEFGVETVGIKTISGDANIMDNIIVATAKGIALTNNASSVTVNVINITANTNATATSAICVDDNSKADILGNVIDYAGDDTGVLVKSGEATIENNEIKSTSDTAIDLTNTSSVVVQNSVVSKNGTGNSAIASTGNATIKGNGVIKTFIAGSDVSMTYGDANVYSVTLTYENGTAVAGKTIAFEISGTVKKATTDANGVASIALSDLVANTYVVNATFEGDDETIASYTNNTITVAYKSTNIVCADSTLLLTAVKSGSYYQFTLTDVNGVALAGKQVTVTFNGASSVVVTDNNGVASYKLSATKTGSYVITMSFAGDAGYAGIIGSATVKLNKEKTKLKVSKTKFKAKTKTKKVKVTLKDSKNKAIKKVKVTIKVKGKTYKAKTNSKGVATVKITKLNKKGTYKAKVRFAGNAYYKAVTKTVKIKVKK